jgi:hypothetical protein
MLFVAFWHIWHFDQAEANTAFTNMGVPWISANFTVDSDGSTSEVKANTELLNAETKVPKGDCVQDLGPK